ncbi:DUF6371 domain-containing protein [Amniculibacterium aquaticum]|uniref:DUF6371 domain-containing protein n=1 Tax=Amniculibacterium aquaticum TaxID=2479858 RepID=UPI000F5B0227|nr:DUF6371 domain-containing protein [Amniculibacterium aquaticum]
MTNSYQYSLDPSSKKHICPQCHKKRFVRYIDNESKELLPDEFGKCDRLDECNYHLNPFKAGYGKKEFTPYQRRFKQPKPFKPQQREVFYFDFETFKKTLQGYDENTFVNNLLKYYPLDEVTEVIERYYLGTDLITGAVTFPFIDELNRVNAIQVKGFDEDNHTTSTTFLHSIIERNVKPTPEWLLKYKSQDKKINCLFGSHLLKQYPNAKIGLVEAPKTAIICTLFFKHFEPLKDIIWLAVYNKSSLSFDKIKALQGRFIYVLPDLSKDGGTFKEWETKVKEHQKQLHGAKFKMIDLLERIATQEEKDKGSDIADFLIKLDRSEFITKKTKPYDSYTEEERLLTALNHISNDDFKYLAESLIGKDEVIKEPTLIERMTSFLKDNKPHILEIKDLITCLFIKKQIQYKPNTYNDITLTT